MRRSFALSLSLLLAACATRPTTTPPAPVPETPAQQEHGPIIGLTAPVFAPLESVLDRLREADGLAFDYDGD